MTLKCSDSYPPFLDGLGKIHKDGVPLHEISQAVGSPGHELMKKVSEILQPLVGTKRLLSEMGMILSERLRLVRTREVFKLVLMLKRYFPLYQWMRP